MTAVSAFVVRQEGRLPFIAALAWWLAMYPGLLAEDSFHHLEEASSGHITVWFTAWWVYLVSWLSMGTRAVGLLTLAGVMTLTAAVLIWLRATFPAGTARAWVLLALCASPVVAAFGIQVRHDAWMTAGLLLWTGVMVRTKGLATASSSDLAILAVTPALIATRHNGLPVVIAAGTIGFFFFTENRRRYAAGLAGVLAGCVGITLLATAAAGRSRSVDPAQAVEWLMGDVSCLLSQGGVEPTAQEWSVLERIAQRQDWPQARACRYVNPLQFAPSFRYEHAEGQVAALLAVWAGMAARDPIRMIEVHATRVALFLPPFMAGVPDADSIKFIHGNLFANERGLTWTFPRAAWTAQLGIRLWNRYRTWLANPAVWLIVVTALWRSQLRDVPLAMTLLVSVALWGGLVLTAPVSEGRYALFIVICGHATLGYWMVERLRRAWVPA